MKRFRLTKMQEAMLFEALDQSDPRYVTVLRYELEEGIDAGALRRRADLLAERHEALRTSFARDGEGNLWQEVADHAHIGISIAEFYKDEEAEIDPFNGKLFRLILCGKELAVIFHHALLDGWSIGVLMRELLAEAAPEGKASPFRYYVKWLGQRSYADDLNWWKHYLDGVDMSSVLPGALNPAGYERCGHRFKLENSKLLRQRAAGLRVTAGRLIQAVWCMLMARYNGGNSVVCGVNSGRGVPVPGITKMVGMCVNTLPVVTRLPKPPESVTFADWISEWSRQAAETERHGFCNLGDIIKSPMPHILAIEPPFDGGGYTLKSSSARLVTDFDAVFTLNGEIEAEFAYNSYAYSAEAVTAIKGHFLTALDAVLENPRIALEAIPILAGAEISELAEINENKEILDIIEHKTIVHFWSESAIKHANRAALVCGDLRLPYAELADITGRICSMLISKGVGAEKPVAIKLNRSERYVIAELAVIMAGGFFVPLDLEWPEERIQAILTETKPFMVIDEEVYAELLSGKAANSPKSCPKPRDAAYMIMTSGTTDIPKGVVIEHRSIANFCLWAARRYGWQEGDSCAMVLGFGFDGSMWDIWLPLVSGGTLHILNDDVRLSISALGEYCRAEHITHIDLPVTMADSFREIYRSENELPDLRVMVTGGEEVRRVVPSPYPLSNEYGPTECTVCCSASWINPEDKLVSVGSPPPNTHAYILDEWGRLCPDGVVGEACFSGVQVARGYYNSPDLTAGRFVTNPFSNGNENHNILYRSGDLMYWRRLGAARELIFRGRADNQVKINGYRIELAEVENALAAHHLVSAATVAVRENGLGEKRICAYVVPKDGLDIAELKMSLASKLPSFMRPAIVSVEHIPLNANGKVDYDILPLPEAENASVYSEPETENEKALISAVSQALNVSNIGKLHNYLELGGNSINAMRVAFRLEREGYEITAREIIASGNLAELAAQMRPFGHGATDVYPKETFIPLSAQQAMVYLAETESPASYTVTLRLNAPGLCPDELRLRLDRAAKLHDILRATFELNDEGHIIGRIHDSHKIPLRIGAAPLSGGIDPLRDPLLDLTLCGEDLVIRYHHIALDGWSVNLLINEMLFDQFPQSASSFAQFANRLAAQTQRRTDDEAWWRCNCEHAKTVQLLPPKAAGKLARYKRVTACPPVLLAGCAAASRKMHVTTAAFTLAAWGTVLRVLGTENDDILIPFVASSRDDDALMGMCAATRPLRFVGSGETFGELARKVQDAMLESIRRLFVPQDIIGKLPEYLFVFEDGANSPAVDASGDQNYDLVLKFADCGEIVYNANRVPEELAHAVASRLEAALKAAVIDRVSVFYEGEYELVTRTFAQGRKLELGYQTAADAFIASANKYTGRVALESEDGPLTYTELYERAKKLADILFSHGIGPGDIVAFSLPRTAEGIIAPIGIALSGAAFLPLDPAWPPERVQNILNDSEATAVISCGMKVEITGVRGRVPADSAYLLYTSGTTGKPKAVIVPQRALANQIAWGIDEFGFDINDKILHYIAFTFDPSLWVLFTALSSGATLSLLPECLRLDPDAVARYIGEHNITVCVFPAAVGGDVMRRTENSSLRMVFLGGEAPKDIPPRTNGLEAVNLYGPTEACVNAAFRRMPPLETATRNIGVPVANTNCYVLDAYGKPCPAGIQGELCIGGVQLAHGYLNRDKESDAAFVENPFFGKLYRTGDLAVWKADGTLEFIGRKDSQVKIRGNRVEIGEIEHALSDIPGISDAKVKFDGDALDAYVIPQKNAPPLDAPEIRRKLSQRLPTYMLPRWITALDAFPLTENGKVDSAALPAAAAISESAEPLSGMEKTIAAAWKSALALDGDFVIGRNDNFFDLGGHSLLLFGVVGLLSSSGVRADIRTLIEHPVLSELANAIGNQKYAEASKAASASVAITDKYRLYVREMEQTDLAEKRPMRSILITGGTGFLGSHLINEFYKNTGADIYLPVRGGVNRIEESLSYYFGGSGGEMAASKRLRVYLADISSEEARCGAHLDAIFHAAADIRHYAPEPEVYRANVTATENMLRLAEQQPDALFAHISTTSAVNLPFIRESDTGLGPAFDNIYQRTKQLAEQRVLDAGKHGLRYAIFRIGHVSPGFERGSVARNWEINAMLRLINAMLLTGLLPEQDYKIGYGYADKAALAIRLLSQPLNLDGKIFHIDNSNPVRLSELFELAGLTGKIAPRNELISELRKLAASDDEAVRQAAAEYLGRVSQGDLEKSGSDIVAGKVSMEATLILLERLGFKWPHVTGEYMKNVIRSLNNKGGAS